MRHIIGVYHGLFKSRERALNYSIKAAQIDAYEGHPL
jgi:hypothetical protein